MLTLDLSPNKFHAPDAASSELKLPGMAALDLFALTNVRLEWGAVVDARKCVQDLGNTVV